MVTFDIPGYARSTERYKFRPLTQQGFNNFHSKLENLNWNFIRNDRISVHDAFHAFDDTFVESYEQSFPEKEVMCSEGNSGSNWYKQEPRDIRDQLNLVSELFGRYNTNMRYKLEINQAKIKYNDNKIVNFSNKAKTLWGLINSKKYSQDENKI
ncbi:hypothetical protein HHI36_000647 [Cryptolaemus montrouzieri]|uniref:Uncharacterized protein n=1 Tax=Cryptolaemus montrouzieri TaxID=559131 RepID=A0ABD2P5C9_9CUCU